jgi:hypothetical protein
MSRTLLVFLFVSALAWPSAAATRQSGSIVVSASVAPYLRSDVPAQPDSLVLGPADIERGYVEVATGERLSLQTNEPSAVMLVFALDGSAVDSVEVSGAATTTFAHGGAFVQPLLQRGVRSTLDLRFRLLLASDAQPGVYPWPIRILPRLLHSPAAPILSK